MWLHIHCKKSTIRLVLDAVVYRKVVKYTFYSFGLVRCIRQAHLFVWCIV